MKNSDWVNRENFQNGSENDRVANNCHSIGSTENIVVRDKTREFFVPVLYDIIEYKMYVHPK